MAGDSLSSGGPLDSLESLRAAFAQAFADFGKSELRLVMIAGQRITNSVITAVTPGGMTMTGGASIQVADEHFTFALLSRGEEKPARARFNELAERGGAWLLATRRVSGNGVAYQGPVTLWCRALYEALHRGAPQECDGIRFWPWNPFAASIEAIHFLERLADKSATTSPKPEGDGEAVDSLATTVLNIYSNNIAAERFDKIKGIIQSDSLNLDAKLTQIHALMPIPPTTSAAKLGRALNASKTAIQKTEWYIKNRKGEKDSEVGRRHEQHRQRGQQYQPDRDE